MRTRSLLLFGLASWMPAAALAAGAPFATPPQPDVPLGPPEITAPPEAPPVAAPPIEIVLPGPAPHAPPDLDVPQGPPDPLPSADPPVAPPDLVGEVDLPDEAADVVLGLAPPFGGELGGGHASDHAAQLAVVAVPEPATALILVLGLAGLAAARRR